MDIAYYWRVLWRHWLLLVVVVVGTAIASLGVTVFAGGGFQIETEILINPLVDPSKVAANLQYDPAYYAELVSEYILDDFSEVLRTKSFAQRVSDATKGAVDVDVVRRSIKTERVHRTLKITISAATEAQGLQIGDAIGSLVLKEAPSYFTGANVSVITAKVIEPPVVVLKPSLSRQLAFWLLRSLVGVVAGAALVFAVHAVDPRLHDEADVVRELGLDVIGRLPKRKKRIGGSSPRTRDLFPPVQPLPANVARNTPPEPVGAAGRGADAVGVSPPEGN